MIKWLLIAFLAGALSISSPSATELQSYSSTPIISAVSPSDGLDHLYDIDPLIYIIVIGLLSAVTGLSIALKTIWTKYDESIKNAESLHKEKLKIALSTMETIKEAVFLVQNIHDQVLRLNNSDVDRRIFDLDIKNHLINISNDIDKIKSDLNSKLNDY